MPEIDSKRPIAIKTKLTNFVNAVINKAATDHEFANQLEEVLIGNSFRKIPGEKKKNAGKPAFNPVEYLHVHDKDKLRVELERKTDSELRLILRSEGIRKGKELKSLERQQMIDEIASNSERILKQGSVFL
jgi:hypothetical protein